MDNDVSINSNLEQRQQDEVNSIESIYGDIFTDITSKEMVWNRKPNPHFQINLESCENADRPTLSLVLDIEFTPTYPLSSPIVKILHPKNILKDNLNNLQLKVKQVIDEYPEQEVAFTIISEIKFMLDEYQSTTEKVLSLEEEREQRLQKQRLELERSEAMHKQKIMVAQELQNKELNKQIQKIQGEYFHELSVDSSSEDSPELEMIPADLSQYFLFENPMVCELPGSRQTIKFRAVSGFIKWNKKDLLSLISNQYIVKPYLSKNCQAEIDIDPSELAFLLTEVNLENKYWNTEQGKSDIQDLESELQLIKNLKHDNIGKLLGFQIDKSDNGWKVRIVTEFSSSAEALQDILETAEFINWGLARNWLIQLLPAIEYLHNSGIVHKLICPLAISVIQVDLEESEYLNSFGSEFADGGMKSTKVLKISYPSFAYRLIKMLDDHPNASNNQKHLDSFCPVNWVAPELKSPVKHHQPKTDVWDLGVLFLQVMIGYDVLTSTYHCREDFIDKFDVSEFTGAEDHAALVYDLLCKMLQPKISKRPTALELNAVQFLRDGPILESINPQQTMYSIRQRSPDLPTSQRFPQKDYSVRNPLAQERRQALAPTTNYKRRYSNNTQQRDEISSGSSSQILGRYRRDFEEVGKLGRGGFGEVVKARNRIEGTFYAIKKIKHRANKLESLLSEVLSLARLNHQYIVRYYGAWFEEVRDVSDNAVISSEDETRNETDSEEEFDTTFNGRSSSFMVGHTNSFQVDYISNSFDPRIEFSDSSDEDDNDDQDDPFEFANSSGAYSVTPEASTPKLASSKSVSIAKRPVTELKQEQPKYILYIQMEFCENKTLLDLIQQGLPENPNEYWRLFRQLLEAVCYIHREGFIHRDLKPMNVFMDKMNNIKVGDFGLAKNSQFSAAVSNNNQVPASRNKDFSTVVGTMFYTAKEVATGDYDEKVDMYSLGIMFFEMCYAMGTGMERSETLNNLRLVSVNFPSNFVETKYKTEKKIIRLLLDHDPKKRPSASELLQSGWLPVEHQDQVIKEALKSLADPASPWQQQVRETLFNQPYSLVKDLMFDSYSKNSHSHILNPNIGDYLMFNKLVAELFCIFQNHGAIEDSNTNSLLPRDPSQAKESVYEVLDRSGSVLTLPYDLILPVARFLSRTNLEITKYYRHEFVFRPNVRSSVAPDKFSNISFEITTNDPSERLFNDAECIKVLDEIVQEFPCFHTKNSTAVILINHYDIVDAVISFAFGNVGIDDAKKHEVIGVLSQLGIDKGPDEIKKYLRDDFKVPYTVIQDLIDGFNFTGEPEKVRLKLRKLMKDSALLVKVDRAFHYIIEVLKTLKSLGMKSPIYLNPLSNYNTKYYANGIMFQVVLKMDKSRRFSRVATGGRFDSLIQSLMVKDIANRSTAHAVGFSLSSTHLFLFMKALLERRGKTDIKLLKWKGIRCDVLINISDDPAILDSAYEILKSLWNHNISCDKFIGTSQEHVVQKAAEDGANWIVTIRQPKSLKKKSKRQSSTFKPVRIKNMLSNRDVDVEYEDIVPFLQNEIDARNNEEDSENDTLSGTDRDFSASNSSLNELSPLFTVDIAQKVVVVPNEAPRGRKAQNKRDKWEIETDSKVASANFIKSIAGSPIISVDLRDEVLDMISMTSIHLQDEWVRKVVYGTKDLPKHFAMNIQNTLLKEHAKGYQMALLVSQKTQKTVLVDLQK